MSLNFNHKAAGCSECDALCCVAIKRHEKDGYKSHCEPGEACPNLDTACLGTGCRVHAVLDQIGWEACTKFDCYGAGPVVTQAFDRLGIRWAEAAPLDKNMLFAFFRLTRFMFNSLARPGFELVVQELGLENQVEQALQRVFGFMLVNNVQDEDTLFDRFLDECPEAVVLMSQEPPALPNLAAMAAE